MTAIAEAYGTPPGLDRHRDRAVPVRDQVEWVSYGEHGNWVIGAPDVLLGRAHRSPRRPSRSAPRVCGCCCWLHLRPRVDALDAPGSGDARRALVVGAAGPPGRPETLEYFASNNTFR